MLILTTLILAKLKGSARKRFSALQSKKKYFTGI